MNVHIEKSWKEVLADYFATPEFKMLTEFVKKSYQKTTVFPHPRNIFNAFNSTPFNSVKVIILGQDPYHNPGQAHGLSFSVPSGINPPPSLRNIYKEIEQSTGITKDFSNGNLSSWTEQGVLLLNAVLTVEKNKPGSHANKGWEQFTDYVIQQISEQKEHCVFMLWGNYAIGKKSFIDDSRHLVLTSPHPSPFSAHLGFFGNRHFSLANDYLKKHHKKPIEW